MNILQPQEEYIMDYKIDGHTTLLALIGSPVGHSGSPAMCTTTVFKDLD